MSSDPANTTFDDPSFRKALRSQLGRETAPPALRARIVAAIDEAERSEPSLSRQAAVKTRSRWFAQPFGGVALAASVLIVIGIGATIAYRMTRRPTANIPAQFAQAMAKQHDLYANEQHAGKVGDLDALRKQYHEKLRFPPLVTTIDSGGWQLADARMTEFERVPTAQLYFTRGAQSLSVFSIPGRAVYWPQDGARYEMSIDNHVIAGFVRGSTMYCIVSKSGDGQPTMAQVVEIVDQLERKL